MPNHETRYRLRKPLAATASALVLASCFGVSANSQLGSASELSDSCNRYLENPHPKADYQACIAYVIDAAGYREANTLYGGLTTYYGFANSPNPALRQYAQQLFEGRYLQTPRSEVQSRVYHWPSGDNFVDNIIRVDDIVSDQANNRVVIDTTETWLVENMDADILWQENAVRHRIIMCGSLKKITGWAIVDWLVAGDNQPAKCDGLSNYSSRDPHQLS